MPPNFGGILFETEGARNPAPSRRRRENVSLSTILTVRRHWLPMIARKRAIVIPDIADGPIDIREGRPTAVRYEKFVLRGRAFLLIEVVSGNQIEDKLFSRLTNQLIIDLPKLMMSIVEYDLMRW